MTLTKTDIQERVKELYRLACDTDITVQTLPGGLIAKQKSNELARGLGLLWNDLEKEINGG